MSETDEYATRLVKLTNKWCMRSDDKLLVMAAIDHMRSLERKPAEVKTLEAYPRETLEDAISIAAEKLARSWELADEITDFDKLPQLTHSEFNELRGIKMRRPESETSSSARPEPEAHNEPVRDLSPNTGETAQEPVRDPEHRPEGEAGRLPGHVDLPVPVRLGEA